MCHFQLIVLGLTMKINIYTPHLPTISLFLPLMNNTSDFSPSSSIPLHKYFQDMENSYGCLGIIYSPLAHPIPQVATELLKIRKTFWASLEPCDQEILVRIPNLPTHVGYIPFPLNSVLLNYLTSATGFGPLGGLKLTSLLNCSMTVETILRADPTPPATLNLALTIFLPKNMINPVYSSFIQYSMFPQTPQDYQPSQHLGIQLLKIPPDLIPPPEEISTKINFDPQLLSIPSGCDLPYIHPPSTIVKSVLLPHQAQGLSFILDRESPTSTSAQSLWVQQKNNEWYLWKNKINGTQLGFSNPNSFPETPLGSILADDMGLGKSLQAISLIACTLDQAKESSLTTPNSSIQLNQSHATLIICPARLLTNWYQEIQKHTHENSLIVLKYHGSQRHSTSKILTPAVNIIITTYEIVRAEFQQYQNTSLRSESSIFSRIWFRIILDEAHTIRTTDSKTQSAIQSIQANRRLCLTGTPLQNSLHDVMALLNFICSNLKTPHNNWMEVVSPYLKNGNVKPLQLILRHVMLRRMKSVALPNLPEIIHKTMNTPLTPPSRKYYDEQFEEFQKSFQRKNCSKSKKEGKFFSYLNTLRGICDHPLLADPNLDLSDNKESFEINQAKSHENLIKTDQIIRHEVSYTACYQSQKIVQLCRMLEQGSKLMDENPKVVIFSTWTRFLDLIGIALDRHGIKFLRLDGSIDSRSQDRCLSDFSTSLNTNVLIASLQTAGVGLNITCASIAFIMLKLLTDFTELDRPRKFGFFIL
ncbi:uncharacterized protein PGTG_00304 [Puccinia graminis f. sp. tritici CRL 75-36-700-3]|uniref:Helicase ATP-binding domain-containing protein n=1 Tax=Puccinia graminis f. sp. tritici (strain CRL 75-36-700-3 / race SCCL) TaxID=418459 RepID=E3JRT8_PUCGT|nr:uncharacterized protein PGTG_00304 [Puccinia graminis f. sp. tritici CRL 75-36-700-3]EFP74348.1 hypothetical protein PGTG_00304 [Puccinia graminis f. sp. tritici CRL 75-36-700-3]